MSRLTIFATLLALLFPVPSLAQSSYATIRPNVAADTDGDGSPDYIECGDFDRDGGLETHDIQRCIDALTDSGNKHIKITQPGDYWPPSRTNDPPTDNQGPIPTDTGDDTGNGNWHNNPDDGLRGHQVLVGDNTTLECVPGVTIYNWDTQDVQWPDGDSSTEPPASIGDSSTGVNSNIRIIGCGVDGGAPTSSHDTTDAGAGGYVSALSSVRTTRGISIYDCDDCVVDGLTISNTDHAGIYMRGVTRGRVINNRVTNSAYFDTSSIGGQRQPCLYIFDDGETTSGVDVSNNYFYQCDTGINTRKQLTSYTMENFSFRDNFVEEATGPCIALRGVDGFTFDNTTCIGTAGILVPDNAFGASECEASGDPHPCCTAENVGATCDDFDALNLSGWNGVFKNTTMIGTTNDVIVGPFARNVQFINLIQKDPDLTATVFTGLVVNTPNEYLDFVNSQFSGTDVAVQINMNNGGRSPAAGVVRERTRFIGGGITLSDGDLTDTTYEDGFVLNGTTPMRGLQLLDFDISGVTRQAFRMASATADLEEAVFRGGIWDGVEPGYQGSTTVAAMTVCGTENEGEWYEVTDAASASDCTTGGGATVNRCRCVSSAYTDLTNIQPFRPGFYDGGGYLSDVEFDGVVVQNWEDDEGIYISDVTSTANVRVRGGYGGHTSTHAASGAEQENYLFVAGHTNITGPLVIDPYPECDSNIATECVELTSPNAALYGPHQEFYEATAPTGTCVAGQKFNDTDGPANATLNVCEAGTFTGL